MLIKWAFSAALSGFFLLAQGAVVAQSVAVEAAPQGTEKVVTDALHTVAPNAKIASVAPSVMNGFYQAIVDGHVLYVSADGKYLIEGEVFDIAARRSLTEESMAGVRKQKLAALPKDKQLSFAPAKAKYTVTVFTDVDCPYCKQFHKQIAEYNRLGIAINYVLFPLSIHPGSDKKAVSVWCAKDRNTMYTAAMNGQDPGSKTCDNPIAELTSIGTSMGVSGTPAVFTADGEQLGGYLPPDQLLARLDQIAQRNAPTAQAK